MDQSQQEQYVHPPGARQGVFLTLFNRSRSFVLLLALFLQILLLPIGYPDSILPLLLREVVIMAAVVMVADTRRHLVAGLTLGIPTCIILIFTHGDSITALDWVSYLMVVALYAYVIWLMLDRIFHAPAVTIDVIVMALCTYLMLGQVWMVFYAPLAILNPEAFSQPIVQQGTDAGLTLTYFSYVTLTTLGYGDISPVSPWARSLAILEALTGTMFLAVLISRLVGTYRSQSEKE